MLIGGILIDKFSKKTVMNIYFILLAVVVVAFVLLKSYWQQKCFVMSFMVVFQLLYVFSCIGIFAMAMQCCWKKISASQFTLFMTIGNLGRVVGAKFVGPLHENADWEYSILFFAVIITLAFAVYQFVSLKQQEKDLVRLEEI